MTRWNGLIRKLSNVSDRHSGLSSTSYKKALVVVVVVHGCARLCLVCCVTYRNPRLEIGPLMKQLESVRCSFCI